MGEPRSRADAIRAAAVLFQQHGYAATGVASVIEESGTPKGSFYFNFPGGKEELGREALTLAGGQLRAGIDNLARSAGTPLEFLRSLAATLAAGLRTSDFSRGCPIATVALETASTSEQLRGVADRQFGSWEDSIARGLAEDAEPGARERELAAQVLMLLEGALIMARVRRTTAPLADLDGAFVRLLER